MLRPAPVSPGRRAETNGDRVVRAMSSRRRARSRAPARAGRQEKKSPASSGAESGARHPAPASQRQPRTCIEPVAAPHPVQGPLPLAGAAPALATDRAGACRFATPAPTHALAIAFNDLRLYATATNGRVVKPADGARPWADAAMGATRDASPLFADDGATPTAHDGRAGTSRTQVGLRRSTCIVPRPRPLASPAPACAARRPGDRPSEREGSPCARAGPRSSSCLRCSPRMRREPLNARWRCPGTSFPSCCSSRRPREDRWTGSPRS